MSAPSRSGLENCFSVDIGQPYLLYPTKDCFKNPESISKGQYIGIQELSIKGIKWLVPRAEKLFRDRRVVIESIPSCEEKKVAQAAQKGIFSRTRSCSCEAGENENHCRPSSPPLKS